MDIVKNHWTAFARNKLQCGKMKDEVMVHGLDPKPQRQYQYPQDVEEGLRETIEALEDQGILVQYIHLSYMASFNILSEDPKTDY